MLNSATDSEKSRADDVDNQIDVASKAFLGLTVACARCHDHKFDPIPTADYYCPGRRLPQHRYSRGDDRFAGAKIAKIDELSRAHPAN